jgi:hypothetical protein
MCVCVCVYIYIIYLTLIINFTTSFTSFLHINAKIECSELCVHIYDSLEYCLNESMLLSWSLLVFPAQYEEFDTPHYSVCLFNADKSILLHRLSFLGVLFKNTVVCRDCMALEKS